MSGKLAYNSRVTPPQPSPCEGEGTGNLISPPNISGGLRGVIRLVCVHHSLTKGRVRASTGEVVLFKRFLKEPTVRMQTFTQKIHTEIANPNYNKTSGG